MQLRCEPTKDNKKLPYINSRAHNHFSEIENEITSILDGEPTTADPYNEK